LPAEVVEGVPPERWQECELFRYGIDLFNHAYWWECHEALEALWNAAGHRSPQGRFFQGIIQVAAAHLKRFMGVEAPALALAQRGLAKLDDLPDRYMGIDVRQFRDDTVGYFRGERREPVLIGLRE
jgi:predicted metal-dependent hydrolase